MRIIGGRLRGRKLEYAGQPNTRPMKDRVREAIFSRLADAVKGCWTLDLFAGTGALGVEALSRGAARATFVERHFPSARTLTLNLEQLGLTPVTEVIPGDAFVWVRKQMSAHAAASGCPSWVVLCAPPYALFHDQREDMCQLIRNCLDQAPPGSTLVVEADERFGSNSLPEASNWKCYAYPPAVIYIYRTPAANADRLAEPTGDGP